MGEIEKIAELTQNMQGVNASVKGIMRLYGITQWQIANKLGIGEATLTRWLRKELTDSKKEKILKTIEQLADKGM